MGSFAKSENPAWNPHEIMSFRGSVSDFNPKNLSKDKICRNSPAKWMAWYTWNELVALNFPLRQRSDSKKEQIENHRVYDHNVNHLPRGWSPTMEEVSYPKLSPSQWVYQAVVEHANAIHGLSGYWVCLRTASSEICLDEICLCWVGLWEGMLPWFEVL